MRITFSVMITEDSQKGVPAEMSDFTDREADRLKQALSDRRVKDEKSVQEHQLKVSQGPHLWQKTREAAKGAVDEINEKLGKRLLLWRSPKSNEIDIIAPEIGQGHNILATFDPNTFQITWRVPVTGPGRGEMKIFVANGEVMWNSGSENHTAEQAAELLVNKLTSTI